MTDKQIIIDGVDVSGCTYYDANADKKGAFLFDCKREHAPCWSCASMPGCLYKKYKAKEQECEELGQAYLETNEILQEKTKECTNLKAENEELKKYEYHYLDKFLKLKDCISEIKEIAEENKETTQYRGICLSILQKISECEVENENN